MYSSNPTTSSSTTSSNVTPKFKINLLRNDATPLYTKEQQIFIKKTKEQLEMEVSSLEQRKQALTNQLSQLKANKVSYGELAQLKKSIELNHVSSNTTELTNLMDEYLETVREARELEAECEILAQRIKKETKHRQNEIDLSNQIADAFDFTSIPISIPEIKFENNNLKDNILKEEISKLNMKLDDIRREQSREDVKLPPTNLLYETMGSYSIKIEAEWQIRSIGTNVIRSQIINLQKQVVESASFINKIEESLIKEKERLSKLTIKGSEKIASVKSNNDSNKLSFENELNQMDHLIITTQQDIQRSVSNYNIIIKDINKLTEDNRRFATYKDPGSQSENNEDDYVIEENNQELLSLMEKKNNLTNEVNDLKKKYQNKKSSIHKRELVLKQKVSKLSNQYLFNKRIINMHAKLLTSKQDIPIDKDMTSLISHIDSTLDELRSTYA